MVVKVLQNQDIPHNMMITYGDPCSYFDNTKVPQPVLRVCLWPVKPSDEVLNTCNFQLLISFAVLIYGSLSINCSSYFKQQQSTKVGL